MDELFAQMKAEATQSEQLIRAKADASKKKHSKKADSLEAIMASAEANEASKRKKEKRKRIARKEKQSAAVMAAMAILKTQNEDAKKGKKVLTPEDDQYSSAVALSTASNEKVEIDAKTSMTKLARTINSLADESQSVRRKSLETIKTTLRGI